MYTHQSATFIKRIETEHGQVSIRVDINNSASWAEDLNGIKNTSLMLRQTQLVSYKDIIYRVLSPELFLLQLCLHGYRDMNSIVLLSEKKYIIRLLCDVYYYILSQKENIKIETFFNIVCNLGYGEIVYYMFYYIQSIFDKNQFVQVFLDMAPEIWECSINRYGLDSDEQKEWNIEFWKRFFSEELLKALEPSLTLDDKRKIDSVKHNM